MHAPKTKTLQSAHPAEDLFNAVLAAAQAKPYTVDEIDEAAHRLQFSGGKSGISWGHLFVAEVVPSGAGSELRLECGGRDDAPKALLDGWKNGRAADKVIRSVTELLG